MQTKNFDQKERTFDYSISIFRDSTKKPPSEFKGIH